MRTSSARKIEPEAKGDVPQRPGDRRVLDAINGELARYEFSPFTSLGVEEDGWKLLGMNRIDANRFYGIVSLYAQNPQGNTVEYAMKFAVGSSRVRSSAIIPMVGDSIAICRQHRPCLLTHPDSRRAWSNELPRAFAANSLEPTLVDRKFRAALTVEPGEELPPEGSLSFRGGMRELVGALAAPEVTVQELRYMGAFPEDTGMSAGWIDMWLLRCNHPREAELVAKIFGPRDMRVRFIPVKEVFRNRRKLGLTDAHTSTLLLNLAELLGFLRV